MAEYREDSIDPRSGKSDIDAKVYFIGNKIQHNTSESRTFREILSEMDNVIGLFNFREVMKKALTLKQAVVDMPDEKLRQYHGYKEHLEEQFAHMTDCIQND